MGLPGTSGYCEGEVTGKGDYREGRSPQGYTREGRLPGGKGRLLGGKVTGMVGYQEHI